MTGTRRLRLSTDYCFSSFRRRGRGGVDAAASLLFYALASLLFEDALAYLSRAASVGAGAAEQLAQLGVGERVGSQVAAAQERVGGGLGREVARRRLRRGGRGRLDGLRPCGRLLPARRGGRALLRGGGRGRRRCFGRLLWTLGRGRLRGLRGRLRRGRRLGRGGAPHVRVDAQRERDEDGAADRDAQASTRAAR